MPPLVWSRRNGPWSRVSVLWVGAAPGNAGGRGAGRRGAHGTRIPFGGDVAGANLDVLLGSIGLDRNRTFILAAYNRLPARGGGEPASAEILAPVGDFENSLALLRETVIAAGPRLVVALGNVALRAIAGALTGSARALPAIARIQDDDVVRGRHFSLSALGEPDAPLRTAWRSAWPADPLPRVLWLMHPSAQNMSPWAARDTRFHRNLRETRVQLRRAARDLLDIRPPARRARPPATGILALPEWRADVAPFHERLDRLWRAQGI